jgi:hypothetical protein
MKIIDKLKMGAKDLRRILRLSPMHIVFRRLQSYSVDPKRFSALEVFGCDGQNHTKDISSVVAKLEIWEIQPEYEAVLKRKFPQAEVKITDSFEEIKRTSRVYDLIVVDNNFKLACNHYEHFDLFPDVFRVLHDPAIMILNVFPNVNKSKAQKNASERLKQRQMFYNAADPTKITFAEIKNAYLMLAGQNGWVLEQIFFERRWTFPNGDDPYYYAVLKLKRQ